MSLALRYTRIVALALALTTVAARADQNDDDLRSLTHMSLAELGKIEVTTASKGPVTVSRTPAAIYVITQEDIRRSGANSIPEALRLAPGVEVALGDASRWSVGIRGFGGPVSRAVLVLIDGRSVYSPMFHGVYWKMQDTLLEDIDRIEVIRGPGGTIWGSNAVNGVINIITRNSRETHGTLLAAGGGSVTQGSLDYRYGDGNGKGLNYRVYGKGWTQGPEFHPDRRNFDDGRRAQGGFRADWQANARDTVTVQGDIFTGLSGESHRITSLTPPYSTVVDQNGELSGGNVLARWRRLLGPDADFELQVYYDKVRRVQSNQAEIRDTFDIDFVHHLSLGSRNNVVWGVGARASLGSLPEVVPTMTFSPARRTDQLYTAFIQDQFALVPEHLWLTVGSKLLHSAFVGFDTEPSVRLLWTPSGHQTVWAAATRAVRTPADSEDDAQTTTFVSLNPLTFSRSTGDKRFVSEILLGYEAGYRSFLNERLTLDIATFYNIYNHLLSSEPGTPFVETVPGGPPRIIDPLVIGNGVRGATSGIEIGPNWKPAKSWRLTGSYSYLHMNLKTAPGSTDVTTVNALQGSSPHHQVLVQSYLDLPGKVELTQTFHYVSNLPAQLVPAYGTGDLRASWRGLRGFEFSLAGQNLLQPHHPEYGGNPGSLVGVKRSVYGSIVWRR